MGKNQLIESADPLLTVLDISNLDAGEQAQVNALADAATTWIQKYCNRIFKKTTYTDEAHNGNGERFIYVDNPPIISLSTVTIQSTSFSSSTTSTDFAASKFDTKLSSGKIQFKSQSFLSGGGSFDQGFQNVLIDYTGGFSSIPEPVKLIAAQFIIEMFDPGESVQGIEKEKLGNYFYSRGTNYFQNLTFNQKIILESYRLRRIMGSTDLVC